MARGRTQRWRDEHPRRRCRSPRESVVGRRPGPQGRARPPRGRGDRARARARRRAARRGPAGSPCVQARRASEAEGAGESGLSPADPAARLQHRRATPRWRSRWPARLFFQVPSGEARGQVALFLGLTMLPFAIVAPLIGPFLDRFAPRPALGDRRDDGDARLPVLGARRRRSTSGSALVFAAALGVLVASKAYGVTRAAAVPRLLPPRLHPGQGQRPGLAGRHRRRLRLGAARRRWPRWSGRSGRCATPSLLFVDRHDLRDPAAAPRSTPARARASCPGAARRAAPRGAAGGGPGSPARSRSRCAPTAGRGSSAASC